MRRTLTLEVAFPFKSHGTLWYARLMQELLRQWENTAELCSLYCQWARREEEGEQEIEKERESQRMRQGERANNVIPFSRQCCSQLYTNGEEDTAACASSLQDPERTGGWVSMWKLSFSTGIEDACWTFHPYTGGSALWDVSVRLQNYSLTCSEVLKDPFALTYMMSDLLQSGYWYFGCHIPNNSGRSYLST